MATVTAAAQLRVGLRRRRRDDAGVGVGDGPGDDPGHRLHLHRARLAVRVVHRAVADHAVAAAGGGRRAAGAAGHRQQHRHAGDDRRRHADGPGHQERDPAGRPDQPLPPRGRPVDQGRDPEGRADPPAPDPDDDLRDDPRDDALGDRQRRGLGVPRADLDCHHRRADHLDGADPGRGAGGLPAAGPDPGAGGGVAPPLARPRPAGHAHRRRGRAAGAGRLVLGQQHRVRPDPGGRRAGRRADDAELRRRPAARVERQRVAEGGRGERAHRRSQGRRGAGGLPARRRGQLPVPAVAEVPRDSDSGRSLRPRGADLRSGVRPPERRLGRDVAAAVYRRPADQQPQSAARRR